MERLAHWIDNADSYICSYCGYESNNPNKEDFGPNICPKCFSRMNIRREKAMERVTSKAQSNCGFIWRIKTPRYSMQDAIDRLAKYEDTGLEPEEITTEPYGCVFYCNRKCNLDGDFCAEGPGCPHEINAETAKHLLDLAQAEKDGRLVVLPCKVGDTVYEVNKRGFISTYKVMSIHLTDWSTIIGWELNDGIYSNLKGFEVSALGKTAFLAREEAEAALKKREEVGNNETTDN